MGLKIEIERGDGEARLHLQGELDIHTAHQLKKQLQPLLTAQNRRLLVDLAGIGKIDSAGIATLAEGLQWSSKSGGRFVLSGLSPQVSDVLELAKLETAFEIEAAAEAGR